MSTVLIKTKVDENHRVILELPDVSPGDIEVELRILSRPHQAEVDIPKTRDLVKKKLEVAGLSKETLPSPEALDISEEERERLSKVFLNMRPLSEQIIEDREDRV